MSSENNNNKNIVTRMCVLNATSVHVVSTRDNKHYAAYICKHKTQ